MLTNGVKEMKCTYQSVIRSRTSKDRQYNVNKKNNKIMSTKHYTKKLILKQQEPHQTPRSVLECSVLTGYQTLCFQRRIQTFPYGWAVFFFFKQNRISKQSILRKIKRYTGVMQSENFQNMIKGNMTRTKLEKIWFRSPESAYEYL